MTRHSLTPARHVIHPLDTLTTHTSVPPTVVFRVYPYRYVVSLCIPILDCAASSSRSRCHDHVEATTRRQCVLKQLLCDAGEGGTCLNTVPGTDLNAYLDNFHLNTGGSIYLWPHLCDAMESIGLM